MIDGLNVQYEIYSIKRLSDNTIFTIGDIVEHIDYKEDVGKIIKIFFAEYIDNALRIEFKRDNNIYTCDINKLKIYENT